MAFSVLSDSSISILLRILLVYVCIYLTAWLGLKKTAEKLADFLMQQSFFIVHVCKNRVDRKIYVTMNT